MRRLTAWIGGTLGGITAYRFLRRRHAAPVGADGEAPPESDDRADELRARLAESRAAGAVADEPPPAEAGSESTAEAAEVDEAPEPEPESPDERRRRVHEEGRAALDDMKSE